MCERAPPPSGRDRRQKCVPSRRGAVGRRRRWVDVLSRYRSRPFQGMVIHRCDEPVRSLRHVDELHRFIDEINRGRSIDQSDPSINVHRPSSIDRSIGFIDRSIGFIDRSIGFIDRSIGFIDRPSSIDPHRSTFIDRPSSIDLHRSTSIGLTDRSVGLVDEVVRTVERQNPSPDSTASPPPRRGRRSFRTAYWPDLVCN